jgi:hypothetical protein
VAFFSCFWATRAFLASLPSLDFFLSFAMMKVLSRYKALHFTCSVAASSSASFHTSELGGILIRVEKSARGVTTREVLYNHYNN